MLNTWTILEQGSFYFDHKKTVRRKSNCYRRNQDRTLHKDTLDCFCSECGDRAELYRQSRGFLKTTDKYTNHASKNLTGDCPSKNCYSNILVGAYKKTQEMIHSQKVQTSKYRQSRSIGCLKEHHSILCGQRNTLPVLFIIIIHLLLHDFGSAAILPHKQTFARKISDDTTFPAISHNDFIEKLSGVATSNPFRRTRSAPICTLHIQQLLELADHAYLMATSGYEKIHTKRHAPRRFQHRPFGELTKRIHEQVKHLFCESHRKNGLFGKYTDDVQESLKSMSKFLQQEMNNLKMVYTSWSRGNCNTFPDYSRDALRRRIINELYEIKISLQQSCNMH